MCGKDGCNFGEVMSVLRNRNKCKKIIVAAVKLLLGLTRATLSQLENIARNLLLKKVEVQHQVSYICTFIHMVMMENHLLVSVLELSMKIYEEILQKAVSQTDIDQCEAYYQVAGRKEKKNKQSWI